MSSDTPAPASDRAAIFFRAAHILLDEKDFNVLAGKLFDIARELIGAQAGYVGLQREKNGNLDVLFYKTGGLPCTFPTSTTIPLHGLREKAIVSQTAVFQNRFMETEHASRLPPGHMVLENIMFIPLVIGDNVAGVMALANKDGGFTDDDKTTAGMLTELIALGLRNNLAERALAVSEARYRAIVENITDGLIIHDIKGTILDVNENACRMLGYGRTELLGSSLSRIDGPRDVALTSRRMSELLERGELTFDADQVRKDGSRLHCSISAKLVSREDDGVIQSFMRDISDRKKMETALVQSELMLKKAQELSHIGHFRIDPATETVTGSDVFYAIFGLPRAEIRQAAFLSIVEEGQRGAVETTIRNSLSTGTPYEMEHWLICPSGEKKFVNTIGEPVFDNSGRVTALVGTAQDISERKLMESVIAENEKKFRLLFENLSSGFALHEIILDADGAPRDYRFIEVNPAFEQLTGLKAADLVGRTARDKMPGIEDDWIETYGLVATSGVPVQFESFSKALGRYYDVIAYSPQRNRFATIFTDITQRKKIEAALHGEQEKARLYFDIAGVMLVVLGPDARVLLINKKACAILGYTPGELIGRNWIDCCVPPENRPAVSQTFKRIVGGAIALFAQAENQVLCKDGSRRLIAWNNEIIRGDNGAITATISSGEDVTARRRAEAALAESERRNRDLLQAIPDIIFKVLNNGAILDVKCDKRAELYLPVEQVQGANIFDLPLQKGDIEKVRRTMSMALSSGEVQSCTYSLVFEGSERLYEARFIRELENTAIIIVRDITESKRAEENMIKTEKLESLGHMAGGIAHDFNNLLGGVFGYLEMAKEQAEANNSARTALYLSKALTVFDRAKGLTRQFLTFAKGGTPAKKTGDLAALLRSAVPFALSGSNVESDLQLAADLWPCDFDEHQMAQVFDNLVINAKQAMENGGRLEIIARNITLDAADKTLSLLPGSYVRIDFIDNGPGVPRELQQKIFDPFFTTKKKGTGLGLATVYSIISKHGGHIDLVSEPGKGADFLIYLPASSGSGADRTTTDKEPVKKGSGRVLLMDDEDYVRDFGSSMLKNLGYTVDTAKNGSDAIAMYQDALVRKKPYKVAIFDLTIIGGMGGREAAQKIMALDPGARLIVSSGYSEDPVMADPNKYGFCERIGKPYRKEELAKVLSGIATQQKEKKRSPTTAPRSRGKT